MTTTQPPRTAERGRSRGARAVLVLAIALLLVLLVRTFVVQTFSIPSDSMSPALRPGERVLVWRVAAQDVQRGDVIVFDGTGTFADAPPEPEGLARAGGAVAQLLGFRPGESDYVKRVVGLPGERITCCDEQGRLLVDGVPLDEPYLHPGDAPSDVEFDIEVPDGRLWLMGDHRSDSVDSRSHLGSPGGGTVSLDDVIGRVVAVTWPFGSVGTVGRGSGS
ncbi:signal peptidase I [Kineococcus radiotolerans]|uniref:Signal peptidase I n=1 Tax=Kineococcus radiotolerans (strain ATCC BAA-149 / DSM 14245 / SRS30216) TaxID=266940 RepID=A6W7V2_KINRD|nr:signal peptidase I [Kineococcus radiotolerans]ABS02891.1 signal peptidase I [Kineococcus radiotolerans SRS30216 = ATCC BAA-149]